MTPGDIWRILAVIVTVVLVATDAPILHQHLYASPAWYDEECPSLRLAAVGSDRGVPGVVDLVQPFAAADAVALPVPIVAPRPSLFPTSPRSPPIAS